MNLTIKRALIRAGIIVLLAVAFIGYYLVTEADAPDWTTTETPQTTPASTEDAPQEPQTATEPNTIPEEEQEPAQEKEPAAPTKEETPTETKPTETEPTYTADELEMLAIVIYREAGGDAYSDETRLMVGTVVMNRIQDERYPDTMQEVLTQKSQYGRLHWTGVVWPKRASSPYESHAVERAYTIAERILQGDRALPEDVVYQAEFRQGTEVVDHRDGLYFCR